MAAIKLAFAKLRYMPEYTWSTTLWSRTSPGDYLDNFMLRSKNFGMVYELGADCWVLEDGPIKTGVHGQLEKHHPLGIKALYEAQPADAWAAVPWGEYDAVICIDPFLTMDVIKRHKGTLWSYYAGEHEAPWYDDSVRKGPLGGYDVFMDHAYRTKATNADRLPAVVRFPPLVSSRAFRAVLGDIPKMPAIFFDSRALRKEADPMGTRAGFEQATGLLVKTPRPWDYANSYYEAAHRRIMSPREYLEEVAGCRYFLLKRGGIVRGRVGFIGQASIEAAALGCVVLSGCGMYPDIVCHEQAVINAHDWNEIIKKVKQLEGDPALRERILAHQNEQIRKHFLEQPIALLEKLIRLKRGKK